ncbi:MAG: hypothetical protein GEU94_05555 [Micromonosporaceae bacterium]|nr:hypothetical protein [Micromonosporaceae bacterium]
MRLTEQQVAMRMATFPEQFADRLPAADLQEVISFRNVGEWAVSVSALIAALHRTRTTISSREARSLRDLMETFQPALSQTDIGAGNLRVTSRLLTELTVTPSLTEPELIDRLRAIPERFRGRLSPEEIELLTVRPDEEEAGVWFEVAYELMDTLGRRRTPISTQERTDLSMILDALDLPRQKLRDLPVA